jgi:hypothetical protein
MHNQLFKEYEDIIMKIKPFYSQDKSPTTWNFIFFFENTRPFSQRFQPSVTPFEKKRSLQKK